MYRCDLTLALYKNELPIRSLKKLKKKRTNYNDVLLFDTLGFIAVAVLE